MLIDLQARTGAHADLLVQRGGGGDAAAEQRLCEMAQPLLQAQARRLLSPHARRLADPEDLAQEVLMVAVTHLRAGRFVDWLGFLRWGLKATRNRAIDIGRHPACRHEQTPEADVDVAHLLPSVAPEMPCEGEPRLLDALDQLPDDQIFVVIARYWLDLPWNRVAHLLGRPSAHAAECLHQRARVALARRLCARGRKPGEWLP